MSKHLFHPQLLVTRPDGGRADNVKVKVEVSVGWSRTLFNKDLIVRNGRAKIDLPEIPFDAKELRFSVSLFHLSCYTRKGRLK